MATPFYAKGPGNEGYIKNLEVIAYEDLDGGSFFQQAMWRTEDGRYYIYGTMGPQLGIVEVTDPANPRFVKRFRSIDTEKYPFSSNPKVQVADGLLITGMCSGGGPFIPGRPPRKPMPAENCRQGLHIYSIKEDPENPKFLGYWDCGVPNSNGVHRFMYDGGPYVHVSSEARGFEGLIYRCVDISDPTHPVEAGRWWMPHQYADGFIGRHDFDPNAPHVPEFMDKGWLHGPPFVRDGLAYCGYCGDGLVILNVEDVTRPYIVGHLPLCPPFGSYYGGARTHTALPLPGRDLVVVTNEGERYTWFVKNNDPKVEGKKIGNAMNAYAQTGWIAAHFFCEGLRRIEGQDITWENYMNALETGGYIQNPFGGKIDYANGGRVGTQEMNLAKINLDVEGGWELVDGLQSMSTLLGK